MDILEAKVYNKKYLPKSGLYKAGESTLAYLIWEKEYLSLFSHLYMEYLFIISCNGLTICEKLEIIFRRKLIFPKNDCIAFLFDDSPIRVEVDAAWQLTHVTFSCEVAVQFSEVLMGLQCHHCSRGFELHVGLYGTVGSLFPVIMLFCWVAPLLCALFGSLPM